MLKKVFFVYGQQGYDPHRYTPVLYGETINFGLKNLIYVFHPEQDMFQMMVYPDKENKFVTMYLQDLVKDYPEIDFRTPQEQKAFEKAYDLYADKRSKEIPQVIISVENFKSLKSKWKIVKELKPKYLVFTLDDSSSIDVVDMYWGDELLKQDQSEIKEENKKYKRWQQAYELYKKDYPFQSVSKYWYGSDDSFFEKDLEPYYDIDTPLLEKKKYTKKQIGLELKEKVARQEYPQLLGKWAYQILCSNIVDIDTNFKSLLCKLCNIEMSDEDPPSYERLEKIADLIVAGRDDEIKLDF